MHPPPAILHNVRWWLMWRPSGSYVRLIPFQLHLSTPYVSLLKTNSVLQICIKTGVRILRKYLRYCFLSEHSMLCLCLTQGLLFSNFGWYDSLICAIGMSHRGREKSPVDSSDKPLRPADPSQKTSSIPKAPPRVSSRHAPELPPPKPAPASRQPQRVPVDRKLIASTREHKSSEIAEAEKEYVIPSSSEGSATPRISVSPDQGNVVPPQVFENPHSSQQEIPFAADIPAYSSELAGIISNIVTTF